LTRITEHEGVLGDSTSGELQVRKNRTPCGNAKVLYSNLTTKDEEKRERGVLRKKGRKRGAKVKLYNAAQKKLSAGGEKKKTVLWHRVWGRSHLPTKRATPDKGKTWGGEGWQKCKPYELHQNERSTAAT